jgi:hypothetical protein
MSYGKMLLGDAGYRSPYLSHAKRALYHLSYIPFLLTVSKSKCLNLLSREIGKVAQQLQLN